MERLGQLRPVITLATLLLCVLAEWLASPARTVAGIGCPLRLQPEAAASLLGRRDTVVVDGTHCSPLLLSAARVGVVSRLVKRALGYYGHSSLLANEASRGVWGSCCPDKYQMGSRVSCLTAGRRVRPAHLPL